MAIESGTLSIRVVADAAAASRNFAQFKSKLDAASAAHDKAGAKAKAHGSKLDRLEKRIQGISATIGKLKTIVGVSGLAAGLGIAIGKIDDFMSRTIKTSAVMKNLKINLEGARKATLGFVSDFELAKAANKALRFGIVKTDKDFAKLTAIATKLGLSIGEGATKAVEDLTIAMSRNSPMILDNLGITLKLSEAHAAYAVRLGKTVSALTEVERNQAFANETLVRGEKVAAKVSVEVNAAAQAWMRAKTAVQNFMDQDVPAFMGEVALSIERANAATERYNDLLLGFLFPPIRESIKAVEQAEKQANKIIEKAKATATQAREGIQAEIAQIATIEEVRAKAKEETEALLQNNRIKTNAVKIAREENEALRRRLGLLKQTGKAQRDRETSLERALKVPQATKQEFVGSVDDREVNRQLSDLLHERDEIRLAGFERELSALELQREILIERGLDPQSKTQAILDAETQRLQFMQTVAKRDSERIRIQTEIERVAHIKRLEQWRAEQEAFKQRSTLMINMSDTVAQAANASSQIAIMAGKAFGASAEQSAKIQIIAQALLAQVMAAVASAQVAWSWPNVLAMAKYGIAATLYQTAAILGFVNAAKLRGSGGGRSTGRPSIPVGGGGGGGGGIQGGGEQNFPQSRERALTPEQPIRRAGGPAGDNFFITVNNKSLGKVDERDMAAQVMRAADEARQERGRLA